MAGNNILARYGYTGAPLNALANARFGPSGWDRDAILPFARKVEDGSVVKGGGLLGSDWHFAMPQVGADLMGAVGAVGGSPLLGRPVVPSENPDMTQGMIGHAGSVVGPMAAAGFARSAAMPRGAAELGASGGGRFSLDYYGQPVTILQNPSPQQAAGFMRRTKYKAARRIQDPETGDVYIWDASDPAMHALVAEQLGIKNHVGDMIGLD